MNRWTLIELIVVWVLTWGLVPHVLAQRSKSPGATLAWIWAIFLLPVIGAIFYVLVGNERLQRKRLRLVQAIRQKFEPLLPPGPQSAAEQDLSATLPELQQINGMPPTCGNAVLTLPDGVAFFPRLIEVIRTAQQHLHLEFYIWNTDKAGQMIRDELAAAAQRGVEVRLLLDEIGSFTTRRSFFRPLEDAGGQFSWFNTFAPLRGSFHLNLRNHRKLVVADGQVALTGGMNVGNEYWSGSASQPPYHDLQFEVRGPCVVQLAQHFAQDWYFASGEPLTKERYYPDPVRMGDVGVQVVAGGPDNEVNEIQMSILCVLQRAQKRVWMMTPYFVPEPPLLAALQLAAMRGVDVRLIVPNVADHKFLTAVTRSYYEDLIPYGVKIHEYQPRLVHAKLTTIDGLYSMAGSANLDIRSLRINFELNLLVSCPRITAQLDGIYEKAQSQSRPVVWAEFCRRSFRSKISEAICRPLSPML